MTQGEAELEHGPQGGDRGATGLCGPEQEWPRSEAGAPERR